jgi:hypothetical protein
MNVNIVETKTMKKVDIMKTKDERNANCRLQQNERDRKAYATRDPYVAKQIF